MAIAFPNMTIDYQKWEVPQEGNLEKHKYTSNRSKSKIDIQNINMENTNARQIWIHKWIYASYNCFLPNVSFPYSEYG